MRGYREGGSKLYVRLSSPHYNTGDEFRLGMYVHRPHLGWGRLRANWYNFNTRIFLFYTTLPL